MTNSTWNSHIMALDSHQPSFDSIAPSGLRKQPQPAAPFILQGMTDKTGASSRWHRVSCQWICLDIHSPPFVRCLCAQRFYRLFISRKTWGHLPYYTHDSTNDFSRVPGESLVFTSRDTLCVLGMQPIGLCLLDICMYMFYHSIV